MYLTGYNEVSSELLYVFLLIVMTFQIYVNLCLTGLMNYINDGIGVFQHTCGFSDADDRVKVNSVIRFCEYTAYAVYTNPHNFQCEVVKF